MSKHTNVINRVRIALGLVKFADAELLDGTKVTAESFEVGQLLSIVAEDGSLTPAPEGTHETADAYITVDANGVITTIEPKVAPVAAAEVPAAMAEVEVSTEVDPAIVQAVIEALLPTLSEMGDKISKMEAYMEKMEKMSSESITEVKESVAAFAKAPGTTKISTKPSSLYEMSKENTEGLGEKVARLKALTKGLNVKF
ncbi:hypothetical protein UFOVP782_33 [uncultured Caudovirales phage]|uniref:Uncharacterized protein n=1 Tax=uncultured Caudovirales phage TaxID=2100421 RepID=A0A6J5NUA0_9CAUD|nr:hypothetical protein UFOVP782_33 [uncultured Caudovirales phage]